VAGEQQASVPPVAEEGKTPTPAGDEQSAAAKVAADAQAAGTSDDKIKEANDKLAERGRELKAERERAKALEAQLEEANNVREKLWYTHPDTPEEEKQKFRSSREQAAKDAPKMATLQNKVALAEAIADEESPVVRSALRALRVKAEQSGKYPDADMIASIRESLTPADDGTQQQSEDKAPPAVGALRGTRAAAGPSIDEQIKEVEKAVKAGNQSRYGELLGLRQQKSMEEAAARK
jgi:hypothetical protein